MIGLKENEIRIFGIKLNVLNNAYDYPTKSSDLNIHGVSQGSVIYDFFYTILNVKLFIFEYF